MKQTKTIPFDWEEYNNNRDKYKVVTRDGDEVTQLTKFDTTEDMCLRCIIRGSIASYNVYGIHFYSGGISQYDLQLQYEEEVREVWIMIIQTEDGTRRVVNAHYHTKEKAINASNFIEGKLIATINLYDL
jgi:hypothetical protein